MRPPGRRTLPWKSLASFSATRLLPVNSVLRGWPAGGERGGPITPAGTRGRQDRLPWPRARPTAGGTAHRIARTPGARAARPGHAARRALPRTHARQLFRAAPDPFASPPPGAGPVASARPGGPLPCAMISFTVCPRPLQMSSSVSDMPQWCSSRTNSSSTRHTLHKDEGGEGGTGRLVVSVCVRARAQMCGRVNWRALDGWGGGQAGRGERRARESAEGRLECEDVLGQAGVTGTSLFCVPGSKYGTAEVHAPGPASGRAAGEWHLEGTGAPKREHADRCSRTTLALAQPLPSRLTCGQCAPAACCPCTTLPSSAGRQPTAGRRRRGAQQAEAAGATQYVQYRRDGSGSGSGPRLRRASWPQRQETKKVGSVGALRAAHSRATGRAAPRQGSGSSSGAQSPRRLRYALSAPAPAAPVSPTGS